MSTTRAIVLARGLGTRMRAADPSARLSPEQQRAADAGLKAMIPVNGRPFLDYILSSLADAGLRDVALVVAPEHGTLRTYYERESPPSRMHLDFVVQREALGTANAVLAAESWVKHEPFLAMNADNLYPTAALATLAALDEPGLPAFDREDLIRTGNIPPFDDRIFQACRDVPRSSRGEFEVPEAVGLAVCRGVPFKTFPASGPVLDLSTRADAADVARRLAGISPRP
jgi:glucose-1-phosphate thymidylyltransferase